MRLDHLGWNVAGLSLPLFVAAATVPHLISTIGTERFGLLALAWGLIGYASVLDLGVGRALTQLVARLSGEADLKSVPNALATASRMTLVTGLIGGTLVAIAALSGAGELVKTATVPSAEISSSLLLLAIALPAQAMSATYRGLNEAFLNFKGISFIRIVLGVVTFGGPYIISKYTINLQWLVVTLVIGRLLSLLAYRWLAYSCLADKGIRMRKARYSKKLAKSLLKFGGWVAVSSVVSPFFMQLDRFFIASLISVTAVTVYVVPFEVVTQSLIIVGAFSSVIFPNLTKLIHQNSELWRRYFWRWFYVVIVTMLIISTALAILISGLLEYWLATKIDHQSAVIGRVLCVGVFANAIGVMFYTLLHAQGRSDLTAKLHIIELPLFCVALVLLLDRYGVVGAAWAWVGRVVFDSIVLGRLSFLQKVES